MDRVPPLGLNRWDWRSPAAFAAEVAEAERIGFDHAFLPVNPLSVPDPYVLLAAGAAATETMGFGPLLETPVLRPPAVAAGSIATVDRIAPGRARLTYGIGDTAVRWLGLAPATVAELEAATVATRRLLAGDELRVGAPEPARLRQPRPVPVWLAAGGPRTLRMAGRVADGVFLRVGTHPDNLERAVAAVRAGAAEADRRPDEVAIALVVHTVHAHDRAAAASMARAMAAGFYEYSPALFAQAGLDWTGPDIEELKRTVRPDFHHAPDPVEAGSVVGFLTDEVADSFSFYGSPADIADQIKAVLAIVPQATMLVPHPVPTPRFGQAVGYARWFIDEVGSCL